MSNTMTQPQGPPVHAPRKRRWHQQPWFIILAALLGALVLGALYYGDLHHARPGEHHARPGEPSMITVPGYTYVNPPSDFASGVQKTLRANRDAFKSASAHGVVHETTLAAEIALFELRPKFADMPGFAQGALEGWTRDMAGPGVRVTMKTIHSERVAVAEAASGAAGYAWCHNGVLTEVGGSDGADVRDYVDAYLQAAHE